MRARMRRYHYALIAFFLVICGWTGAQILGDHAVPATATPAADYTYAPGAPVTGSPVTFTAVPNTCDVLPCSYVWTDDGSDGPGGANWPAAPNGPTGQWECVTDGCDEMRFTFKGTGTKHIRLTIKNANGETGTVMYPVVVQSPPPPEPTPEPTPAPTPDGKVVFDGSRVGNWSSHQRATPDRIRNDPDRDAIRYEVRGTDRVNTGGYIAQRAESLWGSDSNLTLRSGDDYYFGWSTWFAADYPSPGTVTSTSRYGHSLFLQLKGKGTGGSPFDLAARDNNLQIGYTATVNGGKCGGWHTPLVRGGWNDFVLHVKFSNDPSVGLVQLWHRSPNELVMTRKIASCRMATLKQGINSYLKFGIYRKIDEQRTGVLWHRHVKVGTTFGIVNPE